MISTVSTVKNKIGQTDVLCLVKILCPILWSTNGFNLVSAGQSATDFSDGKSSDHDLRRSRRCS